MKLSNAVAIASAFFIGIAVFLLSLVALKRHNELGSDTEVGGETNRFSTLRMPRPLIIQRRESSVNLSLSSTFSRRPASEETVSEIANFPVASVPDQECLQSFPLKCEMYPYVKFWNEKLYEEDCYQSPLRHPLKGKAPVEEQKYMVFQPDGGGWNNIRMAAEVAMIMAHATGRTLVMPPSTQWYLLRRNKDSEDNMSTFEKFFDLEKISEAMSVISMEEFITTVAAKGLLKKALPMSALNIKSWSRDHPGLWQYLEQACFCREWQPGRIFLGFNVSASTGLRSLSSAGSNSKSIDTLTGASFNDILHDDHLKVFAVHGRKVLPYDKALHSEKAIYFPGDYREEYRILTHFYSYLYFADEHIEHVYKRIVRDRLHYHDEIFCAAGRVVEILHFEAAELALKALKGGQVLEKGRELVQMASRANKRTGGGDTNIDAVYHATHIRRGDFQYEDTRLSAEKIYSNIQHLFDRNVTKLLYISTDEQNKTFFAPFHQHFTVRFLADYVAPARLGDSHLNQNHIGMVEQTICANAHTFVGTPYSTFTGYITRMRGYYRDDRYSRTFYTMPEFMYQLQRRPELKGPFWAREFAVAHVEIDDIAG